MPDLKELMQLYCSRVEANLNKFLPAPNIRPKELHEAMRYSVFNGGKRIRPLLVYLAGTALKAREEDLDYPACAVELIHCYSLVHDDMPAMDNDDLRRGKPTCHKQYSESTALLTGDALQTLAFELLTCNDSLTPDKRLEMVKTLASASGSLGMAGGQAIDLASTGKTLDLEGLKHMHELKTGMLIRASIMLGALCSDKVSRQQLDALDDYARNIGLSFQIKDDILDIESDTETLGKPQGSDINAEKITYPALLGLEGARNMAMECYRHALDSLGTFGTEARPLRELAAFIIERKH